jgi:hypothetical protein
MEAVVAPHGAVVAAGSALARRPESQARARFCKGNREALPAAKTGLTSADMSKVWFGVVALAVAGCGGPSEKSTIKSPQDYVAEQERLAAEQEEKEGDHPYLGEAGETDMEERAKWDERQSELELKRAANSAKTCPGSLPKEQQKEVQLGTAKVSLLFGNDGHVKQATIASPHTDTPVGKCVLRAMGAVIVPAFEGPEKSIDWEVELDPPDDK